MKHIIISFNLIILSNILFSQDDSTKYLTLLFTGDLMMHDAQIDAAYNKETGKHEFDTCFAFVKPLFQNADFVIGNLETTMAGKPYTGYPKFSGPETYAYAIKSAGVNILVNANNHCYDKGKKGFERTQDFIDSLGIPLTGTFKDSVDYKENNPLIIEKNGIKIALLNYTYGTNYIEVLEPNIVNFLKEEQILADIDTAKTKNPDKIIIIMHWGTEYTHEPEDKYLKLTKKCFERGADYIIGHHPHVLRPMIMKPNKDSSDQNIVVYSLGNFISNQRTSPRDGGALFHLTLKKDSNVIMVDSCGYYLTWVYKPKINGKYEYYILPVTEFENDTSFFNTKEDFSQMNTYIGKMRKLLKEVNKNIFEYSLPAKSHAIIFNKEQNTIEKTD